MPFSNQAGGGPPKESTMPPGMPTAAPQGLPQFGTGDGIGAELRLGSQKLNQGQDNRSRPGLNKGAFAGIPQLDQSM